MSAGQSYCHTQEKKKEGKQQKKPGDRNLYDNRRDTEKSCKSPISSYMGEHIRRDAITYANKNNHIKSAL